MGGEREEAAADGTQKVGYFHFVPSQNRIHIAKYLSPIRDYYYKNLGDNKFLAREMCSSGCRLLQKHECTIIIYEACTNMLVTADLYGAWFVVFRPFRFC